MTLEWRRNKSFSMEFCPKRWTRGWRKGRKRIDLCLCFTLVMETWLFKSINLLARVNSALFVVALSFKLSALLCNIVHRVGICNNDFIQLARYLPINWCKCSTRIKHFSWNVNLGEFWRKKVFFSLVLLSSWSLWENILRRSFQVNINILKHCRRRCAGENDFNPCSVSFVCRATMWCKSARCWWSSTTAWWRSPMRWASYHRTTPAPFSYQNTKTRASPSRPTATEPTDYHLNSNHSGKKPSTKVLTMPTNCVISSIKHDSPGKCFTRVVI